MKKLLSILTIMAITFTCISCSSKTSTAYSGAGSNPENAVGGGAAALSHRN